MPIIRPLTELRNNTNDIIELAHSEREPVYITKNGYADVVLMSVEAYESKVARLKIYDMLAESFDEVDSGAELKTLDEAFAIFRKKYGDSDA